MKPERVEVGQRWRTPSGVLQEVVEVDPENDRSPGWAWFAQRGGAHLGMSTEDMLRDDRWEFVSGPDDSA